MPNYNSKGWIMFRRIVPQKVRFFLAFPIFIIYAIVCMMEGAANGLKFSIRKYSDMWNG